MKFRFVISLRKIYAKVKVILKLRPEKRLAKEN